MGKVKEFYDKKSILITGGTGFCGKALVEKLLRSCSSLENIYLLVRDKKGSEFKGHEVLGQIKYSIKCLQNLSNNV
jgi:nucleoside-diphosphate-sugar epimerase